MSETNTASAEVATDDILKGLINIRRRWVLFHLRQNGSATVDELVDLLVADFSDGGADAEESVRTLLYHMDLPWLEELNLVEFEDERGVVRLTLDPMELGAWLDLAVQKDIRAEVTDGQETDAEKIRVLVVDDNPQLTEVAKQYFGASFDDITVTTANRVEEAVEMLRNQSFDCIVSDLQMPAISGLDFLKVVRSEDSEIPFLLFTARGSEEVASEAIESDVTGYVIKSGEPAQFDELAERIRNVVAEN